MVYRGVNEAGGSAAGSAAMVERIQSEFDTLRTKEAEVHVEEASLNSQLTSLRAELDLDDVDKKYDRNLRCTNTCICSCNSL